MTDLNIVVIAGRLATDPEVKRFDSGSQLMRLLVTIRTEKPKRRVDVVPVTWWDVTDEQIESLDLHVGDQVWVAGSVQRRFWSRPDESRHSRMEVVAHHVQKNVKGKTISWEEQT